MDLSRKPESQEIGLWIDLCVLRAFVVKAWKETSARPAVAPYLKSQCLGVLSR
jgi:hypothetical protein